MATVVKDSRFDMRMTHDQRSVVERAAALQGKTLTQWALDHLLEAAQYDIERQTTTRLSVDEFDCFARAVDEPMPVQAQRLMDSTAVWE